MRTVFVSSTFADMQKERDILRDVVSARVNAEARKRGDFIQFCDLRWGISTENADPEAASRKVLDVCLDEIDRSNPPMIILLGERFGWVPDEHLIRSVAERRNITLESFALSATALEVEYGAIFGKRPALVYVRDIESQDPDALAPFQSEDDTCRLLMASLKERLQGLPNCVIRQYNVRLKDGELNADDLQAFAETVSDDLIGALQHDWERFESMTPFQRERERQWAFINEKDSMFGARQADADKLMETIDERHVTLCKGVPGSGKSTLSSRIALKAKAQGWDVLPFIGGLTDESNDAMDVLRNTVYYLEDQLGLERFSTVSAETIAEAGNASQPELAEWQSRFVGLSAMYEKTGKRLLVIVDAVDQLFPDELRDSCGFIPRGVSRSVCFLLTAVPELVLPIENVYVLKPLTSEDRKRVIDGVLGRFGKELPTGVADFLVSMQPASSPYYISMAAKLLSMMGESDFESIQAKLQGGSFDEALESVQVEILESCPEDIDDMCAKLFSEAGKRIDSWFAAEVLNYLAVSRYGLRRSDLAALLDDDWSELKFSHLLNYLQEDFQIRTDGRIDFMHKSAREGLRKRLGENRSYDIDIADYLNRLHPHDAVRVDEILYHAARADDDSLFVSYINRFEFSQDEGPEIIGRAALCVRHMCLAQSTKWFEGILDEAAAGACWVELYWFAVNELAQSFGPTVSEQRCNFKILLKVEEQLKMLDEQGELTFENRRAFAIRMFNEVQRMLDMELMVDGSSRPLGIVDAYLDVAKADYEEGDGSTSQRWALLNAYYLVARAYKATMPMNSRRDGMYLAGGAVKLAGGRKTYEEGADRVRIGMKVVEPGLALLDDDVISLDRSKKTYVAALLLQCLGDFYRYLGVPGKSLEMLQSSLKQFGQGVLDDMQADELMKLADVHASFGAAYIEQNDHAHSFKSYTRAIECYEAASRKEGISILRMQKVADVYWQACWVYLSDAKSAASNPLMASQALLWGYGACDMLRRHYRVTENKADEFSWSTNTIFLLEHGVSRGVAAAIVGMLESWVAEDENSYLLDDSWSSRGSMVVTCNFSVRIILRSKLVEYYPFALECCDKGIAASESSLVSDSIAQEDITMFKKFKREILLALA